MKKQFVSIIIVLVIALAVSCETTTPVASDPGVPEWINELPPQDELWGIGVAKLTNDSLARETAISRGRRDIAAQLSTLVQSMLTDYAKESGTLEDSASIQSIERITQDLININVSGASVNIQKRMPDGTWWVRVSFKKNEAERLANQIFENEASRYADFKANEASRMMQERIAETNTRPSPRFEN